MTQKTAVIIGGGTGIGAACAIALAADGFRVAVGGRRMEPLQQVAAEYRKTVDENEAGILCHPIDVADASSVKEFFAWALDVLKQIDVVVFSAGVNIRQRAIAELSHADWENVLQINTTGAFYTLQEILPHMRAKKEGLIVLVSSIAGLRAGLLGGAAYNASKFALSALGTTVALEEKENGIRVTNLYPGEVETPILDQRPVPVSAEHRARILQPEDVAATVRMIAQLPPRAHVSDLVIKPTTQAFQ
ncbi:MAG: SDR family NAD(P)-dependent oxidoreductase [Planctomycetota bacterium]|nr:SDR family NAD(P)-dependent oxidoreductase [Planctomycetota bacterium]